MSKICPACKTENKDEYVFCKNCGTPLNSEKADPLNSNSVNGNSENFSAETAAEHIAPSEDEMIIDGVPLSEISAFVGERTNIYIKKFVKSEITRSKVGWNWGVAALSLFFGPLGAAIMFFYRKMYKLGTILLCADIPVILFSTFVKYSRDSAMQKNQIMFVINFVTAIVFGLLYDKIYKDFAVKKIKIFHSKADPRYFRYGIPFIGGTNAASVLVILLGLVAFTGFIVYLFPAALI